MERLDFVQILLALAMTIIIAPGVIWWALILWELAQ